MGVTGKAARAVGRAAVKSLFVEDRPVFCRVCGRRVRSAVGAVCSRPACHQAHLDKGW